MPPVPLETDFAFRPRIDLRTGLVACARIAPSPLAASVDPIAGAVANVRAARARWRASGRTAPLMCPIGGLSLGGRDLAAGLDAAFRIAGIGPSTLFLEFPERDAATVEGFAALELLRARAWSIALEGAPDCPLPLGGRARALISEIRVPLSGPLHAFAGLEAFDDTPLGLRLLAAREAGILLTAGDVGEHPSSRALRLAGFDRIEEDAIATAALRA